MNDALNGQEKERKDDGKNNRKIGSFKRKASSPVAKRRGKSPSSLSDDEETTDGVHVDRTQQDVLCGRGVHILLHLGNLRLHMAVEDYKDEYMIVKRKRKREIVETIVNKIQATGSRFLKRSEIGINKWVVIDNAAAYHKVSHALRDPNTGKSLRSQHLAARTSGATVATPSSCSTVPSSATLPSSTSLPDEEMLQTPQSQTQIPDATVSSSTLPSTLQTQQLLQQNAVPPRQYHMPGNASQYDPIAQLLNGQHQQPISNTPNLPSIIQNRMLAQLLAAQQQIPQTLQSSQISNQISNQIPTSQSHAIMQPLLLQTPQTLYQELPNAAATNVTSVFPPTGIAINQNLQQQPYHPLFHVGTSPAITGLFRFHYQS